MFKFTIRDLLWLTVVVAVALAWWVHQRQQFRERERWHREALTARSDAISWKRNAEAMAESLRENGWDVEMDDDGKHGSISLPYPLVPRNK